MSGRNHLQFVQMSFKLFDSLENLLSTGAAHNDRNCIAEGRVPQPSVLRLRVLTFLSFALNPDYPLTAVVQYPCCKLRPGSSRGVSVFSGTGLACALFTKQIPKLNSKETLMSSLSAKDRVSLCQFTFADGRRCRTPRTGKNPHFCFDHAQKEARARAAQSLGKDLAYFFSGDYLSACDLSTALGRLIPAVVRGDVKPKTAHTVAYLVQTLMQAIHISHDP